MLEFSIFALVALAFLHFILEGIIAPSRRMISRIELRRHACEVDALGQSKKISLQQQEFFRGRIYNFINGLPHYSIVAVTAMMHSLKKDPAARQRRDEIHAILNDVENDDLRAIIDRVGVISQLTLGVNSVGWTIYVVPLILAGAMYRQIRSVLEAMFGLPAKQLEEMDRHLAHT